jgi:hypothetical protein
MATPILQNKKRFGSRNRRELETAQRQLTGYFSRHHAALEGAAARESTAALESALPSLDGFIAATMRLVDIIMAPAEFFCPECFAQNPLVPTEMQQVCRSCGVRHSTVVLVTDNWCL